MPAPTSLTTHLLSLSPAALHSATTHPFLSLAATASLPTPLLQHWLAQDRLYAISYVSFVSTLLSHLRIPPGPDRAASLAWRIASALIDSLANIRAELALFEATAARAAWADDAIAGDHVRARPATRAYADLFAGATAAGRPPLVGLTVLWATEECYLRAWRYARGYLPEGLGMSGSAEGGGKGEGEGEGGGEDVMQRVFIPNWSSVEFEGFVGQLRGLVDELAEEVERDGWVWRECEGVWEQVLKLEKEFWPDVES